MAILAVAIMGAVIGLAFCLFDVSWGTLRFFSGWFDVHPATKLALGAVAAPSLSAPSSGSPPPSGKR